LLSGGFILVTLSFSAREIRNAPCRDIEIIFKEDELIKISKDEIMHLVKASDDNIIGREIRNIDADHIEKEIEKHQAILKAEVYKVTTKDSLSYSGILGVRVMHRIPVVRIMSSSGSYYLDKNGREIPVSGNYAAHVIVATGYFSKEFAKEQLLPFILYIDRCPFWKAQIEQVHVEKDGDILLTPLIGSHLIELGSLEYYQEKLVNMRAFYDQVLVQNNWNKYKLISLKYKNQVIGKKR
jgi:cell division protein FtsQ